MEDTALPSTAALGMTLPQPISCLRVIRMPRCIVCGMPSAVYCGGCASAYAYCSPAHFLMVFLYRYPTTLSTDSPLHQHWPEHSLTCSRDTGTFSGIPIASNPMSSTPGQLILETSGVHDIAAQQLLPQTLSVNDPQELNISTFGTTTVYAVVLPFDEGLLSVTTLA